MFKLHVKLVELKLTKLIFFTNVLYNLDPNVNPLQNLIETYQKQIVGTPLLVTFSRSDTWKRALIFYKSHKREELIKPLRVSFDGPFDVGVLMQAVQDEIFLAMS
jgi:hypothetical protein